MMRRITTRQKAEDGIVQIYWQECEDQLGWQGKLNFIGTDKHQNEIKQVHDVSIRQSLPLGEISVSFDECKGGAWKHSRFEGTRLDERDLQWATSWAILALESRLDFLLGV